MDKYTKLKRSKTEPRRWYITCLTTCISFNEQAKFAAQTEKTAESLLKKLQYNFPNNKVKIVENDESDYFKYAFAIDFDNDADEAEFILQCVK